MSIPVSQRIALKFSYSRGAYIRSRRELRHCVCGVAVLLAGQAELGHGIAFL